MPPILAFATFGVSLLFPNVHYSADMSGIFDRFRPLLTPEQMVRMKEQMAVIPLPPVWFGLLTGLFAGLTLNAVAAFGEELGWRGLLLKELGHLGFWKSSVIIGFIWGIWHLPLILHGHNYPQHPFAGVFMMIIECILLAPLFSFIRLKAKSVIASSILHGTLNGTYGLAIILLKGGNDLLVGLTGLAGFIVMVIINIGIFVYIQIFTTPATV